MKLLLWMLTAMFTLNACTKQTDGIGANGNTSFYKDSYLGIEQFKAVKNANGTVTVSFITTYERGLATMDFLKGVVADTLENYKTYTLGSDSKTWKTYTLAIPASTAPRMYFAIRYKLLGGSTNQSEVYLFNNGN
jgi:hypothetical protein